MKKEIRFHLSKSSPIERVFRVPFPAFFPETKILKWALRVAYCYCKKVNKILLNFYLLISEDV